MNYVMNKIICLLFSMVFLHTHCVGQIDDSLESTIKKICTEYNEINKNATLKYKQENLEGQSAGGGVIKNITIKRFCVRR